MSDDGDAVPEREAPAPTLRDLDDALYDEARRIATKFAQRGPNPTFSATVLVHEAWVRLQLSNPSISSRTHLRALLISASRKAAIDALRARLSHKRRAVLVDLDLDALHTREISVELLAAISEAIDVLERQDPQMAALYQARALGMKVAEIAAEFETPIRTVERSLEFARGWMEDRLRARTPGARSVW